MKAKPSPAQTTPAGLRKSYKHASLKQRYGVAANRLKDRSWKDGIFLLSNDFSYVFHLSVPSSHFRELMARTLAMETSVSTPGRNSVGAESLPDVSPSGIRHMIDIVDRKRRSEMIAGIRSRDTVLQRGVSNIAQGMELRFRLHGTDLPGCPDKVT